MRPFQVSATKIEPSGPTATSVGSCSSPGALPLRPHTATTVPSGASTWIRWLEKSATMALPARSQATPRGSRRGPGGAGPSSETSWLTSLVVSGKLPGRLSLTPKMLTVGLSYSGARRSDQARKSEEVGAPVGLPLEAPHEHQGDVIAGQGGGDQGLAG